MKNMSYDLIPKRLLSFPSLSLSEIWGDDDNWLSSSSDNRGLSVYEDDKKIYIKAALPGIDPKDVDLTFQEGYLWIRGESKEEEKDAKVKYYRRATQSFSYRVAVPGDIDSNQEPEATYKHGVMTVAFAKLPKAQPKKISFKTDSE